MDLDTLITKLTEIRKANGNLDVDFFYEDEDRYDFCKITEITITPDDEEEMVSGFVGINLTKEVE